MNEGMIFFGITAGFGVRNWFSPLSHTCLKRELVVFGVFLAFVTFAFFCIFVA
jgi:hypothetical protein